MTQDFLTIKIIYNILVKFENELQFLLGEAPLGSKFSHRFLVLSNHYIWTYSF